ncbi:MAG: TonB-dependent receptor plug domain-containing protein, partial [Saprospiraceae bacterium]|nr:TonB-dependent receptor plug domain-containing protein [Saprospiraceae bacterium]
MQNIIRQYILIICGVFLASFYVTAQNDEIVAPDKPEYQEVAFGKQLKKQVTASIFSISGEELLTSRTNNLLVALQGRLPGLRIIQTDGEPGRESFDNHLRGYDSPNNNGVMYIIDGVERYPFGIDIYEVDRVTILRDAAAVSMYGMRASGGVLIITTKRGSEGKSKISVSIDHSMQAPTR